MRDIYINTLEQQIKTCVTENNLNKNYHTFLTEIALCFLLQILIANLFGIRNTYYEHEFMICYGFKIFIINVFTWLII